ncbi:MAG: hypothetical protein Q8P67_18815, partial [archaeon]|nr:hypothetical protein [archaeon]
LYQLNFTAPLTICHNDLNAAAFFFAEGSDDIYFGSWSEAGLGRGVRDITALLVQSLPSEVLAERHAELLQLYHAKLVERGITSYSFEDCTRDFRLFTTLSLVSAVCNGTGLLRLHSSGKLREDQVPVLAHHKLILSRAFAALENLDILTSLKLFLNVQ